MLERFLMSLEIIFFMKKQRQLEKNFIKKRLSIIFLMKKDSLTNKEKEVLNNIDRYLKNISKHLKNLKKHFKKTI